jgi:organic radical activating enzyme
MSLKTERDPTARESITDADLVTIQNTAGVHLTFSMTLACPLRCAHCIVEAGPEKKHTTMPYEMAARYASQMEDLFDYGIRMISFTGGEPLLARRQLRVMSDAAAKAGMVCGVVTASHWAHSDEAARSVVQGYPGIHTWDLSLDAWHKEYLAYEYVRTAYRAAKADGRKAVIRFTYNEPMNPADREAYDFIHGFAEPADVYSQRLRPVGRGDFVQIEQSRDNTTLAKPCVTKGIVVRYDGSMAPCCINLVEERSHPFQFGDPRTRTLREIHEDYMTNPLLQMIRVIGFGEVLRWVREAGLDKELPATLPEDVCDLCPGMVTRPAVAKYLSDRASTPENRLRIGILANRILGENQMLRRALSDLRPIAREIEGFHLADQLLAGAAAAKPLAHITPCRN